MNIGKWAGQFIGALIIVLIGTNYGYNVSFMITGLVIIMLEIGRASCRERV